MELQTVFESSDLFSVVNQFLEEPSVRDESQFSVADSSLLCSVDSVDACSSTIDEEKNRLVYSVEDDESGERLYVFVDFDDACESVEGVVVDVGFMAAPLAGRGYRWTFDSSGEIVKEGMWIS